MTSTATRTDVHSPLNLVTEDYDFVGAFDNQGDVVEWIGNVPVRKFSPWALELIAAIHANDPLGRSIHQCHHCGAHFRYVGILRHTSGQFIAVGETCLDNRFSLATPEFHKIRKAAELDRAKMRIVGLRNDFVAANPDLAWMNEKVTPEPFAASSFLCDVARKLRQYGELSEKQVAAVRRTAAKFVEQAAKPAEEPKPVVPVIEGRIVIEGEIVSTKWIDSDYGSTLKMLVVDSRGFKVWGTMPADLQRTSFNPETGESTYRADKGDIVRFTATVEKSNDEGFGFFKRPVKGSIISTKEGE